MKRANHGQSIGSDRHWPQPGRSRPKIDFSVKEDCITIEKLLYIALVIARGLSLRRNGCLLPAKDRQADFRETRRVSQETKSDKARDRYNYFFPFPLVGTSDNR